MSSLPSTGHWIWILLLPFAASAATGGLLRLLGGPGRGAALAGLAVPVGFLAGWAWAYGLPVWPPRTALAQVPYVALAGGIAGAAAAVLSLRRTGLLLVLLGFAAVAAWSALGRPTWMSWALALKAGLLLAAWLVALLRLESRPPKEPTATVMLAMLALGVAVVAQAAGAPGASAAAALAAAAAGFLAWNWIAGFPFLAPALLGGAGAVVALGGALALAGTAWPPALAVLLLILFADDTAARLPSGAGLLRRVAQPLWLAALCLLPIALAFALEHVARSLPA